MTINEIYKETDTTKLIDLCERFYEQGLQARHPYERKWEMCEKFYKGTTTDLPLSYIKEIAFGLLPEIDKTGYVHIENAIKPLVKQAMAIICDAMSKVTCVPATNEREDLLASYTATDFIKSREEVDDEITLRRRELTNLLIYGECIRYTRYNQNIMSDEGVVGDIETMSLDPSKYVRSITDNDPTKPKWIILYEVMDVDTLKSMYPGVDIYPESVIIERYGSSKLEKWEATQDKCIVKRMFIREDSTQKKGTYIAWTGQTLLQKGDLPNGVFPFVMFKWLYQPGYAYPEGFVEPLIKPQITLNDCLLKLKRLGCKKANPPILLAGNSKVREETVEESGQEIYRYQLGYDKPEFVQYSHDMQETYQLIAMAREDMMATAGLRETSLGRQPREATATQMALLKRSDNAGIGYFKYAFEKSYSKVCHIKLQLAQKYFKTARLIKIVGTDNKPYVSEFYGSQLKGVLDVICMPTPYVDDAMRQNIMMQLGQGGAFNAWQPGIEAEDGYSKMCMILNSGLPNARDIVDNILGDKITFEELQAEAGAIRNEKISLEILNNTNAIMNAELMAQQMQMQFAQGQMQMGQMVGMGQGQQEPMPMGAETGLSDSESEMGIGSPEQYMQQGV